MSKIVSRQEPKDSQKCNLSPLDKAGPAPDLSSGPTVSTASRCRHSVQVGVGESAFNLSRSLTHRPGAGPHVHPALSRAAHQQFWSFRKPIAMDPSRDATVPSTPVDRPGTPPRPPYSPVTPVFAHLNTVAAANATIVPPPLSPSPTSHTPPNRPSNHVPSRPPGAPAVFKSEPPPVPISESENPDAIALRSAISILQMQKQQTLRDIRSLDRLKEAAAADPEAFARELAGGRLRTEDRGTVIQFSEDDAMDTDEENEQPEGFEESQEKNGSGSRFGRIPQPQNIVRMPPINWAKYQIVGEPLERMHEEQLRRPTPGEPRQQPAPEYLLASPYRPLVDQLDSPPVRPARASKSKK